MSAPDAAATASVAAESAGPVRLLTRGLAVGYRTRSNRRVVLEDVDLVARSGELICLLGPNGIGKSTLLRTLSGLQAPLEGVVEIGGMDLRRLGPAELARLVGVVLTERISVGALSVGRVVELGRYPHLGWWGRLDEGDRAVVRSALEAAGALRFADRDINELSDGERQRVLIARAMAQEPQVLLLDEPTAFVDVPSRVELMGLLRSLAAEKGLAVIVSTHDLELALRLADTIWLVEKGGRIGTGCPEDLVLSGRLAETFAARGIRFRPEERAFRLENGTRGRVHVTGRGLLRDLALAVLERQGYTVEAGDGPIELSVAIATETAEWEAESAGSSARGKGFESLARFARAPRSGVPDQGRRAASTRKASSENSIAAP